LSVQLLITATTDCVITEIDLAVDLEKVARVKKHKHLTNLSSILSRLP
jgi:hypothetical protein